MERLPESGRIVAINGEYLENPIAVQAGDAIFVSATPTGPTFTVQAQWIELTRWQWFKAWLRTLWLRLTRRI